MTKRFQGGSEVVTDDAARHAQTTDPDAVARGASLAASDPSPPARFTSAAKARVLDLLKPRDKARIPAR